MISKKLSEITRTEWIGLRWDETTQMGDDDRMFEAEALRTPDEAAQAMMEWDSTAAEREACKEIDLNG